MTRAAGVVVALLVAAFFGVGVWQAANTKAATERLDAGHADARTATLLDHAGTLNPDADLDIARARLAVAQDDLPRARRILLDIVDREPENARAWGTIELVFADSDPALAKRAAARFDRLVPTVPEP